MSPARSTPVENLEVPTHSHNSEHPREPQKPQGPQQPQPLDCALHPVSSDDTASRPTVSSSLLDDDSPPKAISEGKDATTAQ